MYSTSVARNLVYLKEEQLDENIIQNLPSVLDRTATSVRNTIPKTIGKVAGYVSNRARDKANRNMADVVNNADNKKGTNSLTSATNNLKLSNSALRTQNKAEGIVNDNLKNLSNREQQRKNKRTLTDLPYIEAEVRRKYR